jgi:hypothetical protein
MPIHRAFRELFRNSISKLSNTGQRFSGNDNPNPFATGEIFLQGLRITCVPYALGRGGSPGAAPQGIFL